MARITARQAYTRARTKRDKRRLDLDRAMVEARNRYIKQLSDVVRLAEVENKGMVPATSRSKRSPALRRNQSLDNTKITDFFSKQTRGITTSSPKVISRPRSRSTNAIIDMNGIEIITIDDDDDVDEVVNNRSSDITPNNEEQAQITTSDSNIDNLPSELPDIKPFQQLTLSDLSNSFEEIMTKLNVDEDIEIVEMLPPIPLRDHPVHDIDDD